MVTAMDVLNAINLLLVKRYPDRTVYVQQCPKNFARPSFFLELIRQDAESANKGLLAETMYFLLTCFASKDEYYNSDALELIQLQNDVLNQMCIRDRSTTRPDHTGMEASCYDGGGYCQAQIICHER